MLNSVDESKRISANSLAQLAFNLIGYLPAPMFYGFIAQMCKSENTRIPMGALIYSTIFTVIILILAVKKKFEIEDRVSILQRVSGTGGTIKDTFSDSSVDELRPNCHSDYIAPG